MQLGPVDLRLAVGDDGSEPISFRLALLQCREGELQKLRD